MLIFSWGRGNGHITRLIRIASALRASGRPVRFVSHNNPLHLQLLAEHEFGSTLYPGWAERADIWTSWSDVEYLRRSVELDMELMAASGATLVIHDNRLSVPVASLAAETPFISLCQENQMPGFAFPGETIAPIWTDPLPSINAITRALQLPPIESDARELFVLGRVVVPSVPALDPPDPSWAAEAQYLGPIAAPQGVINDESTKDTLLFYRTVGWDDDFLPAFKGLSLRITVATGSVAAAMALSDQIGSSAIEVVAFGNLEELGGRLRAMIHHGGHGIALTSLALGVPSVVLPGRNPERLLNAERLAKTGLAVSLPAPSNGPPTWGPAVDTSHERPSWFEVRASLDEILNLEARAVTVGGTPLEELVSGW